MDGAAEELIEAAEECTCENTVSMKKWIEGDTSEDPELCRSCMLPVTCGWYESELEELGRPDLAERLLAFRQGGDVTPEQVASEMDAIKDAVEDEYLKGRLKEFDCATQLNVS